MPKIHYCSVRLCLREDVATSNVVSAHACLRSTSLNWPSGLASVYFVLSLNLWFVWSWVLCFLDFVSVQFTTYTRLVRKVPVSCQLKPTSQVVSYSGTLPNRLLIQNNSFYQFLYFNMLYSLQRWSSPYSIDHFLPGVKVICLVYMEFRLYGYAKTGVYSLSLMGSGYYASWHMSCWIWGNRNESGIPLW